MSSEYLEIKALAEEIEANSAKGLPTAKELHTSQRVLKRVTDGIYRQPASAIRELISNAYDADATEVHINTDPPSFDKIHIRDNGNGFTTLALSSLITSIGGSSKRTYRGKELGVTNDSDANLSPGGRKLIGKIGIGLFAVSQLTHEFQIITKTKGSGHRTIADIALETHSEESLASVTPGEEDKEFKTGSVRIWTVPAEDTETQGTEIILRNLHRRTRESLATKERWTRILREEFDFDEDTAPPKEPKYHIGYTSSTNTAEVLRLPEYPWSSNDSEKIKFRELVAAVYNEESANRNPSLETIFDNYFNMVWNLALCTPVDYIDIHPFDLTGKDELRYFELGHGKKAIATEFTVPEDQSIRDKLNLVSPERGAKDKFSVLIDGIELARPILFRKGISEIPLSTKTPLLFIGKESPDLSNVPESVRGGDLEFEGYLLWATKVVPTEHRGVLVRINDASGTLFDSTFMKYPVSEQNRLRQIVAEIFVTKGLDAALNIDRESFNYAHPHYQIITSWLHNALRQLATRQKAIAKQDREKRLERESAEKEDAFAKLVSEKIESKYAAKDDEAPKIEFVDKGELFEKRTTGTIAYNKDIIKSSLSSSSRATGKKKQKEEVFSKEILAIAKILEAHGLFDHTTHEQEEAVLRDIAEIISFHTEP